MIGVKGVSGGGKKVFIDGVQWKEELRLESDVAKNISISTLPYEFRYGGAVVYNNEIHILGGYTGLETVSHYKWNGNSWASVSTLPYEEPNRADDLINK